MQPTRDDLLQVMDEKSGMDFLMFIAQIQIREMPEYKQGSEDLKTKMVQNSVAFLKRYLTEEERETLDKKLVSTRKVKTQIEACKPFDWFRRESLQGTFQLNCDKLLEETLKVLKRLQEDIINDHARCKRCEGLSKNIDGMFNLCDACREEIHNGKSCSSYGPHWVNSNGGPSEMDKKMRIMPGLAAIKD